MKSFSALSENHLVLVHRFAYVSHDACMSNELSERDKSIGNNRKLLQRSEDIAFVYSSVVLLETDQLEDLGLLHRRGDDWDHYNSNLMLSTVVFVALR